MSDANLDKNASIINPLESSNIPEAMEESRIARAAKYVGELALVGGAVYVGTKLGLSVIENVSDTQLTPRMRSTGVGAATAAATALTMLDHEKGR